MVEQNQYESAAALGSHSLPECGSADMLDFDPVPVRARRDGWSPERQRDFIEALADCGVVREAAARVGMTEQSATRLRRRPEAAGFSLAWDAALRLGGDRLRSTAYERAVEGVVKKRYWRGRVVGEERVYDNRLLISLLAKFEPVTDRAAVDEVARDWEGWLEAVELGLDRPVPKFRYGPDAPVWPGEDGSWWTAFPAPPGFNGRQEGAPGDADYRRECTLSEIAAIDAAKARELEEACRRRDLFFRPDRTRFFHDVP